MSAFMGEAVAEVGDGAGAGAVDGVAAGLNGIVTVGAMCAEC